MLQDSVRSWVACLRIAVVRRTLRRLRVRRWSRWLPRWLQELPLQCRFGLICLMVIRCMAWSIRSCQMLRLRSRATRRRMLIIQVLDAMAMAVGPAWVAVIRRRRSVWFSVWVRRWCLSPTRLLRPLTRLIWIRHRSEVFLRCLIAIRVRTTWMSSLISELMTMQRAMLWWTRSSLTRSLEMIPWRRSGPISTRRCLGMSRTSR